ncbi:MAG: histidinol-phosphate transaminase [Armatimonadota bacterium]|nr:MAG: histidinol-phosphate transaminase [Armatimonadota bacterium]
MSDLIRPEIASLRPYSPGKPIEEVQREYGLTDIVKLASNENPLGPSPLALEAMKKAIEETRLYPDNDWYHLRREVAEHLGLPSEQVAIGRGSDEIILQIGLAFLRPGDRAFMPEGPFSQYEFTTRLMGGECVMVPMREYRYDLRGMARRFDERTKIVWIGNPNNPTGTIVTIEEVTEFMDAAPEDCVVVFDEAYFEYVEDGHYPDTLTMLKEGFENILILRTFSKIYSLAGLRIGYGFGPLPLIEHLMRVRAPFNVSNVAMEAARASLRDHAQIERSVKVNREGKEYLYGEFERLGLAYVPTHANFILLNVAVDCRTVFEGLLRQGVIVRTGDIFGMPTHIRVTIGLPEQNARFIAALEKTLAAVGGGTAS